MYVNTGGGGKSQQQQPLQNQTNVSVRHNNPYTQSHPPQQPHYEHHQGPVTYVYPFCNVAQATHGNAGGSNVGVGGGQPGHVLFQAQHQLQTQPHPTQQQVGLHNTEQTLHYLHHLHHTSQQHTQLRNMITVNHPRQPYVVSPPNYFALSHALLPQPARPPMLTNAAPQHAVAAGGGGGMTTQLQNSAPRGVPPNGPAAYVTPPYCTPSLLLSAAPTAVAPQPGPLLTAATGMVQPPSLQAYAQMSGVLPAAPTPSAPINIQHAGIPSGATLNTEHNSNINITTNINIKQRKHAIPIIHPDTMEIFDPLVDAQSKAQSLPPIEAKIEANVVETVSIQTDTDKSSLAVSLASDFSDVIPPTTCSNSSSAVETDKINIQIENEDSNYDTVDRASGLAMETAATVPVPEVNTKTQSLQSGSESLKNCAYDDPNDTDADTNEHELDNEDLIDATDDNLAVASVEQDSPSDLSQKQQIDEVPRADVIVLQAAESDTDHTTETEIKSKDEPYTASVQTSSDRNDDDVSKEMHEHEDLQSPTTVFIAKESKRNKKNRKNAKPRERHQKNSNSKQQPNKSNNASTQKLENYAANSNVKTAAGSDNKSLEPKSKNNNINISKKESSKPTFMRYTLEELKALAKSSESCKTPVVPCQKGDCIAQLFVARQQHHHLSHQGQSMASVQHHVQQSYHQMNFNESIGLLTGKRRSVGGGGGGGGASATARKHQEHHINLGSSGNNSGLQTASGSAGGGSNSAQLQKKMQLICINLSLNEEIKLSECKNAWQPKFLTNSSNSNSSPIEAAKNDNDDMEDVVKKVRGILNKLTSDNFDVLLKEMTSISINTPEKMKKIMLLIFEKTVSEPNFAPTYAKFCKVLFEEIKAESKDIFNNLLIKRLEKEFESNVNNADAKERKLQQIMKKLNETTDQQEKIELQAELEHQEYQFRRRAWGTVRFIGEMFKLRSLSANRVFVCVESLLKHGNEEKLEYMCKLLTTVGNLLESNDAKSFNSPRMNEIFDQMQAIVREAKEPGKKKIKICSRVRFMMQDLIDLRSRNWGQPSYGQSGNVPMRRRLPEDKNSGLPSASVGSYERGSAQRMSFGNNNRQNQSRSKDSSVGGNSSSYYMQKSAKSQYLGQREQQSIDLKKLNFSHGDDSSPTDTKLGTCSVYMWRVNTDQQAMPSNSLHQSDRLSPSSSHKYPQKHQQQQQQTQTQCWGSKNPNANLTTKAILETCSSKDSSQLINHFIEEYLDCLSSRSSRWQDVVFNTWQKTNNKQQLCLVYYILIDYLHLTDVKRVERNACANIFVYLMNSNVLNNTTFLRAYEQFAEEFPDLLVDVPNGWTNVFEFVGPLLHEHLFKFSDIWCPKWRSDQQFTERFVNALVTYFTKEFGANYMRRLWNKEFKVESVLSVKSNQQQWNQFIVASKLQFLNDSKAKPEIASSDAANNNSSATIDHHVQRLETLLSSPNDSNLPLDYINTNVNINICFLQKLTRFLCCDYATTAKTATSRTSSATTSKNSSTCSNTSSSSNPKNLDIRSNSVFLNINAFRNNCLPLLRLCLDGREDHELACLDSVVDGVQQEYDPSTACELICAIFDVLDDCEVIAKETFERWYKLRLLEPKESKIQIKRQLCFDLKSYMQKLL